MYHINPIKPCWCLGPCWCLCCDEIFKKNETSRSVTYYILNVFKLFFWKNIFLFNFEITFFIFRVTKMGFFVKILPNIWCKLEPLYFCKILDHILFTIDQSFHVIWFLYTSSEKDKFPQIQLERGQIWTTCAW